MIRHNRRRFFLVAGGAGGLAGLGLAAPLLMPPESSGEVGIEDSVTQHGSLVKLRRKSWALGSRVSITVLHPRRAVAEQAVEASFQELRLVESLMSIYRPDSQLCRLNQARSLSNPHPYLLEVLRASAEMSAASSGAFDITVQPLWNVFAKAKTEGHAPGAGAIEAVRKCVDWRRVNVSRDLVRLHGKGTAITLNGIAQGYAADRVLAALRRHGIENALVDAGEIDAIGHKEEGGAWRVGIQHPRRKDAFIALADLQGRCLSTSGDYATTFSDDRMLNHLFDPRTGRSPTELASVSIAAPTGMLADALSTAVFVMGPDQGMKLLRATPGADALLVLKNGQTLITRGFPRAA